MKPTSTAGQGAVADQEYIDRVLAQHDGRPGSLLSILEELQERHPRKYLCMDVLEYVSEKTGVPPSQIFSVVTFYALFNLKPQGEHVISICRGTACHTRGSRDLLERLKLELNIKDDSEDGSADKLTVTSADGKFTLRTVACFGQCALAPVVEINHAVLGHVNEQALQREVRHLTKGGAR
jgi:NADH-quinone oxidoreductase subunit E